MDSIISIIVVSIVWLLIMAATIEIFVRKGQSTWLGIVVGLLLGPIGLIIGLVMPKDKEAIEDRKRLQEQRQADREAQYQRYQAEYELHQARREAQPSDESIGRLETLSTISATALIASPFLVLLIHNEPVQIAFGLAAVAGLVGLTVANK